MEKEKDLIMEIVEVNRIYKEGSNKEVIFHKEISKLNNNNNNNKMDKVLNRYYKDRHKAIRITHMQMDKVKAI